MIDVVVGEQVRVMRLCTDSLSCGCARADMVGAVGEVEAIDSKGRRHEAVRVAFATGTRWVHTRCVDPVSPLPDGIWID